MRQHLARREASQRSALLQEELLGLGSDLPLGIEQIGSPQGVRGHVDLGHPDQRPPEIELRDRPVGDAPFLGPKDLGRVREATQLEVDLGEAPGCQPCDRGIVLGGGQLLEERRRGLPLLGIGQRLGLQQLGDGGKQGLLLRRAQ